MLCSERLAFRDANEDLQQHGAAAIERNDCAGTRIAPHGCRPRCVGDITFLRG